MLPLEVFYLFLSKNFAASNFLYYLDNLGLLTLFFFYFSIVDSKHFHLNYQSEKFLLSAMPEYDRKKKIQEVFSLFLSENFCCWQMFFFLTLIFWGSRQQIYSLNTTKRTFLLMTMPEYERRAGDQLPKKMTKNASML